MGAYRLGKMKDRLEDLKETISTREMTTDQLAATFSISKKVLFHCISSLREQGHPIQTVMHPTGWVYVMEPEGRRPGKSRITAIAGPRRMAGERELKL